MSLESTIVIKCEGVNPKGLPCKGRFAAQAEGRSQQKEVNETRSKASAAGWSRHRPSSKEPMADFCPGCTRRRAKEAEAAEKAKTKATPPRLDAPDAPGGGGRPRRSASRRSSGARARKSS